MSIFFRTHPDSYSCYREQALALLQAERESKANRRFLWEGFEDVPKATSNRVFSGICVEVISGDTISVSPCAAEEEPGDNIQSEELKVCLSNLRAPRVARGGRGGATQPWAIESREFLRSRLIGKRVEVTVDYEKYVILGKNASK